MDPLLYNVSSSVCLQGHNGFDELRRYIKGGGEFCKELAVILQERYAGYNWAGNSMHGGAELRRELLAQCCRTEKGIVSSVLQN